jgi:hypothetical protein
VRAVVDDQVVVYRSCSPAYAGRNSYKCETRIAVELQAREGVLRYGPLPRALCEREGDY